jgi:hypothetical protein
VKRLSNLLLILLGLLTAMLSTINVIGRRAQVVFSLVICVIALSGGLYSILARPRPAITALIIESLLFGFAVIASVMTLVDVLAR